MPGGKGPYVPPMTTLGTITDGTSGIPGARLRAKRGDYWVGTEAGADGRWAFPFSQFDVVLVTAPGYREQMFAPRTLPFRVTMRKAEGFDPAIVPDPPGPPASNLLPWVGLALLALWATRS